LPADEAAAWHETDSLTALREAVDTGAKVRTSVARAAGLSESELRTLEHLVRGAAGPAELARRLGVSTAAVTGILDRLQGRGHLERTPDPVDRRRTALSVTASGRAELRGHLARMFTALATLDETFTEGERAVVARYLRGVTAAFEEIIEHPAQ
jgi:DNA-binding MarR family transcriptional regulator